MREYWVVRIHLREDVSDVLFPLLERAGTCGVAFVPHEEGVELQAYFEDAPPHRAWERACARALQRGGFAGQLLAGVRVERVAVEEWARRWREHYKPFPVGHRFLIAPSWDVPPQPGDRLLLIIDPGMAFGTGTHETTQQCLCALEEYWTGRSLVDVGTGTGILALAAARLSPTARIVALDIDPEACAIARENFARHGVADRIRLLVGTIEDVADERFEMILANLTADVHRKLVPAFVSRLEPGGLLVLSGLLEGDEPELQAALRAWGLLPVEIKRGGEWRTIVARYEPSSVLCTSGSDSRGRDSAR